MGEPRRVLFLDFDGVINGLDGAEVKRQWGDVAEAFMDGLSIRYSPTLVEEIEMLAESGVEIVWLTTWLENTSCFPEIGFSVYPWIGKDHHDDISGPVGRWWKWQALQAHVADLPDDTLIAWADDDIAYSEAAEPDIGAFLETDDVYGISPIPEMGLRRTHLNGLRDFFKIGGLA